MTDVTHVCDWCHKSFIIDDGGACIKTLGVPGCRWMCGDCRRTHYGGGC